jgi:hypothetical protein
MIRGVDVVEGEERSAHVQCLGREPIEEEGSSSKGISPVEGWHGSLKKGGFR